MGQPQLPPRGAGSRECTVAGSCPLRQQNPTLLVPVPWPRALLGIQRALLAMLCFQKVHVNGSQTVPCTPLDDGAGCVAGVPGRGSVPPRALLSFLHLPIFFHFLFFPQELYRLNSWDDSGDFAQRLQEYHRADRQGLQRKCILIPQLLSCKVPRAQPARLSPACSTRLGRLPPWSSVRCRSWGIYPGKGNKACEVEKEHRDTQGSLQHSRDFTPWLSYAELPSKYSPDLKQLSEHPTSR